jgi:pimeloyl-ACP methyl ester carboxylesterase
MLVGEHSPLVHPATALARARLFPGAQAEVVAGTGHGPAFERPDYANARITAFIASAARDRAG